jgi:hypothetical protein
MSRVESEQQVQENLGGSPRPASPSPAAGQGDDGEADDDDRSSVSESSSRGSSSWNRGIINKGKNNKSLPLWIIAVLWIALAANWGYVLFVLKDQPTSASQGPVPKWQRDQKAAAAAAAADGSAAKNDAAASASEPSTALIDSMWLYGALPAMYMPTIVVFSYVNWLGWQFFKYN